MNEPNLAMHPRTTRILLVLSAFVAGLVLFSTVVFLVTGKSPTPIAMPSAVGGPFALVDQDNKPITDKDMAGHPFLVFFGFTHCPDVCPTTLFDVSEVFRALGSDKQVRALFVTVDPERDTPPVMKDYLSSFDPRITGATGDDASIAAAVKAYRVYAKKVPLDGGGYTMDHTAIVYLMGKDGRFVMPFNMKRRPNEAAEDLKRYL
jgi:protein SCO1/2